MIVLKIIGWVLLSLLAIIVLALCVRVRFRIEYSSENTSVVLRWLFIKLKLYPAKEKDGAKKKKKKEKADAGKKEEKPAEEPPAEEADESAAPEGEEGTDASAQETQEKKSEKKDSFLKTLYEAEGVDGLLLIVKKVMSYTKTFFSRMLHAFVIDELFLEARCTKDDAASTALYYGEVCSVVFPAVGSLASKCRLRKYDINIYPDYLARFSSASFVTAFHFTPMYLLGVVLAYGCKMLFGVLVGLLVKIFGAKKEKGDRKKDKKISKEKSEVK